MTLRNDMVCVYIVRPDASGASVEFLQLRRTASDYLGGTWQTVYGTQEPGETAVDAALREMREETSLAPRELYRIGIATTFYTSNNDTTWIVPTFCAFVSRDDVITLNEEHEDLRWIPRQDVHKAFMWPSDRTAVESLCADILDNSPAKAYLKIL
jgi:8-oxo-dGTP pyrophosphatase MutT (NUDIX family)